MTYRVDGKIVPADAFLRRVKRDLQDPRKVTTSN